MKVKSESEVAQSCPTLRDPMDCWQQAVFVLRTTVCGALLYTTAAFLTSLLHHVVSAYRPPFFHPAHRPPFFHATHQPPFFFFPLAVFGSDGKESACNAGDPGSIHGSGRSPGGTGNPLQYSCLENTMDRGAWWATFHGVAKSLTRLSD